jgi:penicillin amidase
MRRVMRRTFTAIAVIAVAVFAALLWYRHAATPTVSGQLTVRGLLAPVEIARDSMGVPSIWARNEHDALFAQGYVHAQDRLWQMEMMRHVGEGRLSELFGDRVLDTDRFLRVFGLPRAAALQDSALDSQSRERLSAYADGVNAFLSEGHTLPPEYQVLRIGRPAPWTVRHTLAVEKVMALNLTQYFLAKERTRAVQQLGAERAAALQPAYPSWGPTIIEGSTTAPLAVPPVPDAAAALIAKGSISNASNAWVIGGARTLSHKPILANDMHLDLGAPSVWYLVALHAGTLDVAGMSIPGSPFVVAGHNRAIAWGLTNVMLDDADLFIERPDPSDPARYLTPDGSAQFVNVVDTIRVKGRDNPEILRYRITRHGPVISDVEKGITSGSDVIALQWIGAQPSHSMLAMPALNRARNWTEFRSAVALFDDPHQNVVYADTAGHIGYQMGGRIPDRGTHAPPSLPVPGWTGEWDWRGYIPFEQQPMVFDPPQGYVVTANNRQAVEAIADRISDGWETPFRAARIREMILTANKPLTALDVHHMQLDVHDALAARYRDRAIDAVHNAAMIDAGTDRSVATVLTKWDGAASRDSKAAAIFYVFYDRLRAGLVLSLYGDSTGWMDRSIVDAALENRRVAWPARKTGAPLSFDSIAAVAMKQAIAIARNRTWGEIHHVSAVHPLGAVSALDRTLHLNVGNEPGDGSQTTVNFSAWKREADRNGEPRFHGTVGPSQRHVVDMSDVDGTGTGAAGGSGFILPGGQSGLPFASSYRDQWSRWLNGGVSPIPLAKDRSKARTVHTLTLMPPK